MRGTVAAAVAALALAAAGTAGCGSSDDERAPDPAGSTLETTWVDRDGDGALEVGGGERPVERTDLAPASRPGKELARLGLVSDVHLVDEESPARVAFLDRLGSPFTSTFRPQEALAPRVLAAMVDSLNALEPDAVLELGDLVDSAQANEVDQALAILGGGTARTDSGRPGYEGPQRESNPDPLYYRPDVDAPQLPGLLEDASRPVASPGLRAPWYPVMGNHDLLVAGELAPTDRTRELAVGGRALTRLDESVEIPGGDDPVLDAATVDALLADGLPGDSEPRSPDPARRQLDAAEVVGRLRDASDVPARAALGGRLDYSFDAGEMRVIVLDVVRRDGGSSGRVDAAALDHLRAELGAAGDRPVVVATHQPLRSAEGGGAALELLDADPDVVAVVSGHAHRNAIAPRRTPGGGYWLIETASLADFPQQGRAVTLVATENGGRALVTWMVDGAPGDPRVADSRRLAHLDAQGGRPDGAAGMARDRNAVLFLPK